MFIPMVLRQLGFNQYAIEKNLEGVSDDDALATPASGGSSLNWVLGHILDTRRHLLAMAGQELPWKVGTYDGYDRGTTPDGAAWPARTAPSPDEGRRQRSRTRAIMTRSRAGHGRDH